MVDMSEIRSLTGLYFGWSKIFIRFFIFPSARYLKALIFAVLF